MHANRTQRKLLGILLLVGGVVMNPWLIETVFVPDGDLESLVANLALMAVCVGSVVAGVLLIRAPGDTAAAGSGGRARGWILALASLVVTVAITERVLKSVGPDQLEPRTYVGDYSSEPSRNFVVDSLTGWRGRPNHEFRWRINGSWNTYALNPEGFRSGYDRGALGSASAVIGLAGDSFAFGTGVEVEQTFGARLDSAFTEAVVYNVAMPGFGIDQMWMSLRHQLLPLEPQVVVVAFIDHDLYRSLEAFRTVEGMTKPTFVLEDGSLREKRPDDRPPTLVRWLQRHSTILNLWRDASTRAGYTRPIGEWWHLNSAIFAAMQADADASGVPLIFVRLPLRNPTPFPQLATFMEEAGSTYLDLNSSPREAALHFENDAHIDERGHRFVAERLVPVVERLLGGADQ